MANQKPKTGKTRNDDRKNGKAYKQGKARGSRRTPLDEGQKIMMGGGMLARAIKRNHDEALVMRAKARKSLKDEDDD